MMEHMENDLEGGRPQRSQWLAAQNIDDIRISRTDEDLVRQLQLKGTIPRWKNGENCSLNSTASVNMKTVQAAFAWKLLNPLKGRGVNWLHLAIQI